MKYMQKIIMTKGLPASGKSTWAKEQLKNGKTKRVNKDDLRAMIDNGTWSRENEKLVLSVRDEIIIQSLSLGYNVIVDDTNFSSDHKKRLEELAKEAGADFEIKDFTDVPLVLCLERDAARHNPVGKKVIMQMFNQYLKPAVPEYKFQRGKVNAIICDIDGTLAHMKNRGPFDWHKVEGDFVDQIVHSVIEKFKVDTDILIVSGRDGVCETETRNWLTNNGIEYDKLFMRPVGNNEKDSIIKERIFREQIDPFYNILFVLDDRKQVIDMWRSLGLKCFQVADGDF